MAPLPATESKTQKKTVAKELFPLANILVATDFSSTSDRAVDFAVSLARRFGSRVFVTHILGYAGHDVMEPNLAVPAPGDFYRQAEKKAKELEDSGRLFGVQYQFVIEEGTLWPALQDLIERHKIDLLVLGTHGISGVMKVLTGSSAEQVFRQARIPVLTVGPGITQDPLFEAEFKTILCATDFGPAAEREVACAFALAQEHRAKLLLLHVSGPKEGLNESDLVFEREAIVHALQKLVPADCELTSKLEFDLAFGEPVEQILKVAGETKADLVVIGAKSRENLAGHIPHTKAYRIVCHAKCPVLTVKS